MARPRTDGRPSQAQQKEPQYRLHQHHQAGGQALRRLGYEAARPRDGRPPIGQEVLEGLLLEAWEGRWYHIGNDATHGLAQARDEGRDVVHAAAKGGDPVAEGKAKKSGGTFEQLAKRYVEEHRGRARTRAGDKPRPSCAASSLPKWGKTLASDITRSDVKAVMEALEGSPYPPTRPLRRPRPCSPLGDPRGGDRSGVTVNPCQRGGEEPDHRPRAYTLPDEVPGSLPSRERPVGDRGSLKADPAQPVSARARWPT